MFDLFNRRKLEEQAEVIDGLTNVIDLQSRTAVDQAALIKGLEEANEAHRLENIGLKVQVGHLEEVVSFHCRARIIRKQTLADIERELAEKEKVNG